MKHPLPYNTLQSYLENTNFRKVMVVCDERILQLHEEFIRIHFADNQHTQFFFFPIPAIESHKEMSVMMQLLDQLLIHHFDKNHLIINLGGGIISDLGGFAAAVYKRGISFVNVPTTLLGMVDAAHGGKNGVNFHHLKNGLGSIYFPQQVFIEPLFLYTLSDQEWLNGFAELLKTALIGDAELWYKLELWALGESLSQLRSRISAQVIKQVANIKNGLVQQDPQDRGVRQQLNFGHTIGHALESFHLEKEIELPHGFAVAAGIYYETELATRKGILAINQKKRVQRVVHKLYDIPQLDSSEQSRLIHFITQDKKNKNGEIHLSLISEIGKGIHGVPVSIEEIESLFRK
ncbi:MAG TPA: 3-dehydroquinate synthase [Bacteroidales bacterium]|nr:3-dehydroquinate synthase [Bacteroidales bacterium]HOH21889.1 3-dehydroquinate synthase [Bacteroidales bacterium]HPB57117.1 3-dehydroquinate synthase [Bacteroidales bacterium]HPZ03189.1 3-dehydroquinate synthase [Bacteroidales bacterium]HQB74565.1 3-dehydroquinate synthase [Bacteroidales bacterium]